MSLTPEAERRWRLILGRESADALAAPLDADTLRIDEALEALYEPRPGGLSASSPKIARWLGDIRRFFPQSVVRVMQRDAVDRLQLQRMLLEPELLIAAEPDVHLVATILALKNLLPNRTRDTARQVVQRLVDDLRRRLEEPLRQAVVGALARQVRNPRPRLREIDWGRTIRANLKTWQPALKQLVPERLVGYGRKRNALRDVLLCVDQSGSMAVSVVYSSIFAAVLASLPSLSTRFVVFDTAVVDLTAELRDPVELLFGTQLGGGTDIHKALVYCESQITRPSDTVMVLISDLCEGGDAAQMLKTATRLTAKGVRLVVLLALSDEGHPMFDERHAGAFAALGAPVFACTPDQFAPLMAAALRGRDLHLWAQQQGLKAARG